MLMLTGAQVAQYETGRCSTVRALRSGTGIGDFRDHAHTEPATEARMDGITPNFDNVGLDASDRCLTLAA